MGPVYHGSIALLGTLLATPVVVGQANALLDPSNGRDMPSIRTDDAEVGVAEVEGRAVRAWVVQNRRLTIDGAEWFVSDTPADREIRGPADD